jgi:hypothetical protein
MVARLTACAALLALVACTTASGSFCDISKPVRLSAASIAALSDAEVRDMLAHNRKGEKLCNWVPR